MHMHSYTWNRDDYVYLTEGIPIATLQIPVSTVWGGSVVGVVGGVVGGVVRCVVAGGK